MKIAWWMCWTVVLITFSVQAKRRRKLDAVVASEDFEFEEDQAQNEYDQDSYSDSISGQLKNNNNGDDELCRALKCPQGMVCLVQNKNAAMCIKKGSKKSSDESTATDDTADSWEVDDSSSEENGEEEIGTASKTYEQESNRCQACPVVKPSFVCGSDNQTFSSPCRLHFHNCVHESLIKIACKGFCPCKVNISAEERKQMQVNRRTNDFVAKYKMTVNKLKNNAAANRGSNSSVANPTLVEDKQRQRGYNDVVKDKLPSSRKDCPTMSDTVGSEILNWFSKIMTKSRKLKKKFKDQIKAQFPFSCPPEVRWMFTHLDAKSHQTGRLLISDLEQLLTHQRCASTFLEKCDVTRDSHLSATEWCKCFSKSVKPCANARSKMAAQGGTDSYVPECDADGFYVTTQCNQNTGICWCVDRNGIEYSNSRTRSKPKCNKLSHLDESGHDDDDTDDDDEEDDDVIEGSGDRPLVI